ncbi:hypothetical protein ACFPZL_01175 [Leucobacter soli]|uniref:Uncharacterized protein n=1 Tax=Leucobacter soli TaxID=2812850 RepID=A0A916NIQ8_9MICO|nr:hypothetical protein [Leucobacter soli]CAG7618496.1 hypothetical protein LEUCIP111803_02209 [Leucobacter soli]
MTTPIDPAEPFDPLHDLLNSRYGEIDAADAALAARLVAIENRHLVEDSILSRPIIATHAQVGISTNNVQRRGNVVDVGVIFTINTANTISTGASFTQIGQLVDDVRPPFNMYALGYHANGTCQLEFRPSAGAVLARYWNGTQPAATDLRVSSCWWTDQPLL